MPYTREDYILFFLAIILGLIALALIGNRYDTVGFDTLQEDYYSLTAYDTELACTDAGKRLMRHTKADMLSIIGQCRRGREPSPRNGSGLF